VTRKEAISYFEELANVIDIPPVHLGSAVAVEEWAKRTERLNGAYRLAISALREQPRWISVEERLPDNEDVVLCVTKNKRPFVCRYDHYWKHWRVSKSVKVTHWMYLPEPPTEEEV
jgi:hypothetical protein